MSQSHLPLVLPLAAAVALNLAGCGGSGESAPSATSAAAPSPATTAAAVISSEDARLAKPNYRRASRAAREAAATDPLCDVAKLGDFYWEIGDGSNTGPIVWGSQGNGSVVASTQVLIASASKWVFGAYVLEKLGIEKVRSTPSLMGGMRFTSGYINHDADKCLGRDTVGACYDVGNAANPVLPFPRAVGKFSYDGGHDQRLAAFDLGMANFTAQQVDQEYRTVLGLSKGFAMLPLDVLMAGGLQASANDYAGFLRKIMNRKLVIGAHLGEDSVCAAASECPGEVVNSPINALGEPWRYSYNHWVESEKGNGTVDAYSSPGKFGFYPWISPDLKYYGILSRDDRVPEEVGVSAKCGRQIRKAFLAGL